MNTAVPGTRAAKCDSISSLAHSGLGKRLAYFSPTSVRPRFQITIMNMMTAAIKMGTKPPAKNLVRLAPRKGRSNARKNNRSGNALTMLQPQRSRTIT